MQQSAAHSFLAKAKHPHYPCDNPTLTGRYRTRTLLIAGLIAAVGAPCSIASAQTAGTYQVTPIITDTAIAGTTTTVDAAFINPWGISGGNTLWINTANTGFSYLSSVTGVLGAFKATVPPASGTGTGLPSGTIQNTTASGFVLSNGTKASFLFSTLDGTISGWNSATSATGNHAIIQVNNSSSGASYTDMALVTNTTGSFALVPNFGAGGKVEIYNTSFQTATLAGTFTDPNIPAGYAPYAIKVIGTQVFITYMLRPGSGNYQPTLGPNTGFVSVFDVNGNYVSRAVTGGNLNAPWGITIASAGFGIFGGDLLVGNFGDGLITAYKITTDGSPYLYQGTLADNTGKPIANPGLWEIFVSTSTAALPNSIYFDAGTGGQKHGLLGVLTNSTTAVGSPTFNFSSSTPVTTAKVGSSSLVTLSIAPTNSFAGTVTFSCSGLPTSAACSFATPQLNVSATAPATEVLTIQTSAGTQGYLRMGQIVSAHSNLVFAMLLPFGALLSLRRRKKFAGLRILGVLTVLAATTGLIVGCGGSGTAATPAGTSSVVVTASSGSVSQTTTIALTVQ
ncbi:MAG TPA: TIGR03118 family protein [Acidobacteriaceae bacterium]